MRAMPLTALALVLCAALLHALWNIAAKKSGGGDAFLLMVALMVGALWAPLALALGWRELLQWRWREWGLAGASTLVHLTYFRTLLRGYRESDLTIVYSVARGTGPLVTVLAALLLLDEALTPAGVAGVLGVCGGVFVLAGGPRLWRSAHDPAQRRRVHNGLLWGALTGLCIAAYSTLDGYAVKVALMSPILLNWLTHLLQAPLLARRQWRERTAFMQALRTQWRHALLSAVLGPVAYAMVLYAVTMAPLSHVAPAREVSMLIAALLGGRLLGEGDRGWRLLGAACIAGGVVTLAFG